MTPSVAERIKVEEEVNLDRRAVALFRALDDTFGKGNWAVNDDPRYAHELRLNAIDVFAPIEKHRETQEKASALQVEFSRQYHSMVYLIVTVPDKTNA